MTNVMTPDAGKRNLGAGSEESNPSADFGTAVTWRDFSPFLRRVMLSWSTNSLGRGQSNEVRPHFSAMKSGFPYPLGPDRFDSRLHLKAVL